MDIATLLESHRRYMLEHLQDNYGDGEAEVTDDVLAHAHDRATTKTLLDLYRSGQTGNGEAKPLGQAALTAPVPTRGVKAGSKAARQRAIKAGETRRKNLADKAKATAQGTLNQGTNSVGTGPINTGPVTAGSGPVALSPATHLAPRPPEGGAA